jgi:hypothetical protein
VTTSGTSGFNLDLNDIIEEAYERCGVEVRTGYEHRTARRSLNLLFADWANRGINLWTIEQGSISLVQGQVSYDLPVDTVDLLEHVIRTGAGNAATQADLTISRISVSTYATIPNKLTQGRPIQVWVNRQSGATEPTGVNAPQINVWPAPDGSQAYTIRLLAHAPYPRLWRWCSHTRHTVSFSYLPCIGVSVLLSLEDS